MFRGCRLESITIPASVTSIEAGTFVNLKRITFEPGSQLKEIPVGMFNDCQFESVVIPRSVTIIADDAFVNTELKHVAFEPGSKLGTITPGMFRGCRLESIVIPRNVATIADDAFVNTELKHVAFEPGSKLGTITPGMFRGCRLESITIPASVTSIEARFMNLKRITFEHGSQLTRIPVGVFNGGQFESVVIPRSVTTIQDEAFADATFGKIMFESGSKLETITEDVFCNCRAESIEIPASVTKIATCAFQRTEVKHLEFTVGSKSQCHYLSVPTLESIVMPANIIALADSPRLKEIKFASDSKLVTIPARRFDAYSHTLRSIVIPKSVTSIKDKAFEVNIHLEHIAFESGSTLKTITSGMFGGCGKLKSLVIPASVTEIEPGAIPASVESIAFEPGSKLRKIKRGIFRNDHTLKSIVIPANVAEIEPGAIPDSVQSITFEPKSNWRMFAGNLQALIGGVFNPCAVESIVLPKSVQMITSGAFYSTVPNVHIAFESGSQLQRITEEGALKGNLKIVELPAGIQDVDLKAFESVEYITFEDTERSGSELRRFLCDTSKLESLKLIEVPKGITDDALKGFLQGVQHAIYIDFRKCDPTISGENPRGLLEYMLGRQRNEKAIGCRVLFPGKMGEKALFSGEGPSYELIGFNEDGSPQWKADYRTVALAPPFQADFDAAKEKIAALTGRVLGENASREPVPSAPPPEVDPSAPLLVDINTIEHDSGLTKSDVRFALFSPRAWRARFFDSQKLFTSAQIKDRAFEQCENLRTAIIPEYMSSIGNAAFSASGIRSVFFEPNITLLSIGDEAFRHCSNLNSITIPQSVCTIGHAAFMSSGVRSVIFEANSNLTAISEHAFRNCFRLDSITIPNCVRNIGTKAFSGSNIHSVFFEAGSNLTQILEGAFASCTKLNSIMIPRSVESIEFAAFLRSGVRYVSFENESKLKTIDVAAFYKCKNLRFFVVPPLVERIGKSALASVKRLDLTYNNLAQRHQDNLAPFLTRWLTDCCSQGCIAIFQSPDKRQYCIYYRDQWHELTQISKPTDLHGQDFVIILPGVNLEACNFQGVKVLILSDDDVSAGALSPEKLKNIYDSLEYIEIPNSVEHIDRNTFVSKNARVVFDRKNHVKSIGKYAFFGCNLGRVDFPSVSSVEEGAFCGAKAKSIKLPEGFDDIVTD
jgi:hypothetical protein